LHLDERIKKLVEAENADFFGVADLSLAHDAIREQGGPLVAKYPRSISIGIRLLDILVDELPNRHERAVALNYRHHAYDIINRRLDLIASPVSSLLQDEGYDAYPVPASERYDDERICAVFSHKLAANLAGLGWIGKSCLLVTPEAGPRVRWVTVLTDAPLKATGSPMEVQCGDCQDCVDICPPSAFTGRAFSKEEPREMRYDARKCEKYFEDTEKTIGLAVCGLCLYVCPHGRK
jgi:epoxyqueuosine reductase